MDILLLDIETRPSLAYVWGLYDQTIGISQLAEATEVICFAAKWLGDPKVEFYSVHDVGKEEMIRQAHRLLDEADVVMHFNGKRFDIPHLNREFLLAGLAPPAPYEQIDLFLVAKRQFNFPSNKLAYVSKALGLSGKVQHEGFELWLKCMAGDDKAWSVMRKYNKQDVVLLEDLYERLRPWVPNHPSFAVRDGSHVCPTCGSDNLMRRGIRYTAVSAFQLWRCNECQAWSRSTHREDGVGVRAVTA